jgi:hypothetical protein
MRMNTKNPTILFTVHRDAKSEADPDDEPSTKQEGF